MAYVLRYAGLLKEAERECDTALALDPGNYQLRSCDKIFSLDGNNQRAMEYRALDMGSSYSKYAEVQILLRQGRKAEAQDKVRALTDDPTFAGHQMRLLEACLEQRPDSAIEALAKGAESFPVSDPEIRYETAEFEAICGRDQAALRFLDQAVKGGYCSYPAMDSDPLFASLRRTSDFQGIHSAAMDCQKRRTNQHPQ
jgi:hypothetical protein